MPQNGFTVGRDVTVNINTPNGPLTIALVTDFDKKPNTNEKKIKGIDGIRRTVFIPDGWDGTFEVERKDSVVDDYFAKLEADYYSGIGTGPSTITETITEPSGQVSQYRYTGVMFRLDEAGSAKGDDTVQMKISWAAERRIKVS